MKDLSEKMAEKNMKISMVIPCYNSSKTLPSVTRQIISIYEEMGCDYEIILVNDCSKDNTWDVICELGRENKRIKGINLAKNAGQHAAVMAGFRVSDGDLVMASDDDGQTPVENIPKMIEMLQKEELDAVCARYVQRGRRSAVRSMGSRLYQRFVMWLIDAPEGVLPTIFMVTRRYVIDEICKFAQPYPMFGPLLLRTTNRVRNIEVEQHKRLEGKSGYTFKKLVRTFMNGFVAFSIKPLRFSTAVGMFSSVCGFLFGIYVVVRKLLYSEVAAGWSSTVAILLFMLGLVLMVLGMMGEYLGRMYMTIAQTPQYVVRESINTLKERENEE